MAVVKSFELNGNKQSFASWISNLSPCDTPFTSMIGKEGIDQTQYSWQTDTLSPADNTAYEEGSLVAPRTRPTTKIIHNFTSILRKAVSISATSEVVSTHGRNSELAYQMTKAGKEIMRDLEWMNLSHVNGNPGTPTRASKFAGFEGLVAGLGMHDGDTGAVVHKEIEVSSNRNASIDKNDIFDMTYNLYLAGSKADKIMFHPKHSTAFSLLIGENLLEPRTYRMFDGLNSTFNTQLSVIRDPLGRNYTLIPNRFMPEDKIYFFTESDWTQMVLQAPRQVKLAKTGSSENRMIEMEVGLRHTHPYASGVLALKEVLIQNNFPVIRSEFTAGLLETIPVESTVTGGGVATSEVPVYWYSSNPGVAYFARNETKTTHSGKAENQLNIGNRVGTTQVWSVSRGVKSQVHTITTHAPIIELTVSEKNPTVGSKVTLTAQVKKFDNTLADKAVTVDWYANPSEKLELDSVKSTTTAGVATVEGTCLQDGTVLIQACVERYDSNPIYMNYVPEVSSLVVDVTPNTLAVNGTSNVIVQAIDHEGNVVPNVLVSWQLSDAKIATTDVYSGTTDATGIVQSTLTGNSRGTGVIIASYGSLITSDPVVFFVGGGAMMEFVINPNPGTVGANVDYSVTLTGQDGSPLRDIPITFTTNPSLGSFTNGTTDNSGILTDSFTPLTSGTWTVTARCDDFAVSETLTFEVTT